MRVANRSSTEDMLEVLNKQWLNVKDIKVLASVSLDKARKIKNEIIIELENQNYYLPTGLVPSEEVVKYLKINVSYLKKIRDLERGKL